MLPEGWEHIRLREGVSKIGSGVTPRGGEESYKSTGYPLIRSQNVGWGCLLLDNVSYIDLDQHNAMSGTKLKSGDVLLNITGASIGRVATYYGEDLGANVNQHVCIIRTDGSLEPRFVEAFLLSEFGQKQVDQFQAGGNRQGLNFEQVGSFRLPRPPLPEQQKIAEILSTWDAAIGSQERLIANAKRQKMALMQTLLTAESRLPSFSGKWVSKPIGEVALIYDGTHMTPDYVESGVPFYSVEHLTSDDFKNTKFISELVFANECRRVRLEKNDILMTRIGDIGTAKLIDWDVRASFYVSLALIKPGPLVHGAFLAQFISASSFRSELHKRTIHVAFPKKINLGEIGKCLIALPPVEEQRQIAEVLSASDGEISTNVRKLEALRQEKSALMQQLLTGKRRVRVGDREFA